MNNCLPLEVIYVKGLRVWAHVGVLEEERLLGQFFNIDFKLWLDLNNASIDDKISSTADYSKAIEGIQHLCFQLRCFTLEHFCKQILDCLEDLYGAIPMQVSLTKCSPPVKGFNGTVLLEMQRNSLPLS